MTAPLLVAANRGPVSYAYDDDGTLVARRGGGGMVSGLVSALGGSEAVWVCSAMSRADRDATGRGGLLTDGPVPVRMLDIDPDVFHRAYNEIANSTLWFVSHLLYDTPLQPRFDAGWRRQWEGYVEYNRAFADALADEAAEGARVVVQDYHLFLVPAMLRDRRPDVKIAHFTHTPWAPPDYFALLPDDVAAEILRGLAASDHVGFLADRWAQAYIACAERVLGSCDTSRVGVHPLGVDADDLRARSHGDDVETALGDLREEVGGRAVLVRVDRTELSKNNVRGIVAFGELLRAHPEHRGEVVHVVFAYPSRQDLRVYRDYTTAVMAAAGAVNDEFATDDWQPVLLSVRDDYPRSLAAMRLADVLVVNPVRDGMNLVAKEGPVLSDEGVVLLLSREAGAAAELSNAALMLNPYDIEQTTARMHEAITMDREERTDRTRRLVTAATALPPDRWFADQLAALT
ncbi:MAG: alpha,alpha-trehalose-phosphate synthase (UDP-forming) [Mycobacteriales bacterium]